MEGNCVAICDSIYDRLDLEIGWERRRLVAWPSIEGARELARKALGGSVAAFRELFIIKRWTFHPRTADEIQSAVVVDDAFMKARSLFGG